jgi:beta-glucosidase
MSGTPAATVTLTEPVKLSNGGNTVFAPGVNLENFSARLDGTFIPTRDETLLFTISGDDKIRLLVNGDTLVDIWKVRHRIQGEQKELQVKAGQHYSIQIDYVQESGYGALNFDIQHKTVPTPQELLAQVGEAETVVFVGGISPRLEGEEMRVSEPGFRGGDRTSIELPQAQRDVLRWLHEAGKKVIFVNCSGGAMAMMPELETCDAILQWWYGGEQGGAALADVLTGRYNPSGKLPVTFYKSTDDLPDFLDYTMKNRTYRYFTGEPLFPFGHGLSYTTFTLSKPTVKTKGDHVSVSVKVKNTGRMDGTETIQLYFRRAADTDGPLKTLCGYQQVSLKAGEERTVTMILPRQRFETWDAQTNTMRFQPGQYQLMVGPSSADASLKKINVKL